MIEHKQRRFGWVGRSCPTCPLSVDKGKLMIVDYQHYIINVNICKLAFTIKHSSTIIPPQWFTTLQKLALDKHMMSQDVCTHWNSTYNMLAFTYHYKDALNKITAICEMKLRDYKIEPEEWNIVCQL